MNFNDLIGLEDDQKPAPVNETTAIPTERFRVYERMVARGMGPVREDGTTVNSRAFVVAQLLIKLTKDFEEIEERERIAAEKKRKEDEAKAQADAKPQGNGNKPEAMPGNKPANQRAA